MPGACTTRAWRTSSAASSRSSSTSCGTSCTRPRAKRTATKRKQALARLHDKVASITIGDPACGSGNFLTEAYRQLRTIENRIIEDELSEETGNAGQTSLVIAQDSPVRVSLDQLYGIEINDFAVSVARPPFGSPRADAPKDAGDIRRL